MLGLFVSVESGEDVDGEKDGSGECFFCLFVFWGGSLFHVLVFFAHAWQQFVFLRRHTVQQPLQSIHCCNTASVGSQLVKKQTHTWEGRKEREEQSFQYKLSERKNLISNINAGRATLCAIVLLSFQKLVF